MTAEDRLHAEVLERYLAQRQASAGAVHVHGQVGSTNDLARELAEAGTPDWTVVVAEAQSAGRGRRGRAWASPAGSNLYLSVVTPEVNAHRHWPRLPIVAGVAAAEAIERQGCRVGLKWPNDLMASESAKVGGILLEGLSGDTARAVIGIGVNANAAAGELPVGGASLRLLSGAAWDRNRLAAALVARLQTHWRTLTDHGFGPIQAVWSDYAVWLGQPVAVIGEAGTWTGELAGIDQWGRLRLMTAAGEQCFSAGDVSLRRREGGGGGLDPRR